MRSLQLIHVALVGGVAACLIFVVSQGIRFAEDEGALPLIPLGFPRIASVAHWVSMTREELALDA